MKNRTYLPLPSSGHIRTRCPFVDNFELATNKAFDVCFKMSAACRIPMPWLQTNVALYLLIGPGCWVPLHERDAVLDSTQRRRAVQRAPPARASCHQICACGAHLCLENGPCYYTLINIMAHYRPSNTKEIWCTNDVKICNNDLIIKQGVVSPGLTTPCFSPGFTTPCFIITSLLHIITSLLHHYYIIITMSIMGKMIIICYNT